MQLPVEFETRMKSMLGTEGYAAFSASLNHPAQSAFRPNKAKGAQSADHLESVPWSSTGKYLCQRPAFTFDPLFHAGVYYVQEPSSMFIEQALHSIDNPCRVLDLCASPGGKSTLLRSLLPDNVLLVCNEPIKLRAQVLLENMLKWGHSSVIVTNNYPKDFARLTGFFDVIAADVPCSGEGMFRKDNPAISEWSPANVSACAERQMEIVRDVWPALTDGGYLIYSTCTYNPDENERNVERICKELEAEAVEIPVNESWGITGNLLTGASFPAYHFLPSRTRGEGFFLALIRKKGGKQVYDTRLKKQEALAPLKKVLNKMLDDNDGWLQWEKEDLTFALHDCMATGFQQLAAVCHILSAGIPLATHKGNKLVPHHALSLSLHLNRKAFPAIEISRDDALNYLRRLSLTLPAETERGYVLLTYQGFPLGFANNLGNRANNLYPQNWKIRSSHATDMVNGFIRKAGCD